MRRYHDLLVQVADRPRPNHRRMIAVLTAGGRVHGEFARHIGTTVKALAPWRAGRLIDPAIVAARDCGASKIVVIGDGAVRAHCQAQVDLILPELGDGRTNLALALQQAQPKESLLLLTSDLPFLTAAAVEHFLAHVGDAEAAMPLATAADYQARFPDAPDHVTELGREKVANGSIFYFASDRAAAQATDIAGRLFTARKSLFAMARLLDVPLLARFLVRRLAIEHIEDYARRRFSLHARAIRNCAPELCFDIDTLADLQYAQTTT